MRTPRRTQMSEDTRRWSSVVYGLQIGYNLQGAEAVRIGVLQSTCAAAQNRSMRLARTVVALTVVVTATARAEQPPQSQPRPCMIYWIDMDRFTSGKRNSLHFIE